MDLTFSHHCFEVGKVCSNASIIVPGERYCVGKKVINKICKDVFGICLPFNPVIKFIAERFTDFTFYSRKIFDTAIVHHQEIIVLERVAV